VSADNLEAATSVTILALGYRALHQRRLCKPGRPILRYADTGRPVSNCEFCHAHAREKLTRDRAGGLRSTTITRFALQPAISSSAPRRRFWWQASVGPVALGRRDPFRNFPGGDLLT
jgi:hypothetical protein